MLVGATDDGDPARSTSATLRITVDDVNEHPTLPVVELQIDENMPPGAELGTLHPTDPDAMYDRGSALGNWGLVERYEVLGGTAQGSLTLTKVAGAEGSQTFAVATSTAVFDYESANEYTLDVMACDGGAGAAGERCSPQVTLAVKVLDKNEAPVIETQSRTVAENSAELTPVGAPLTASDVDALQTVSYEITGPSAFSVNPCSGQISVATGAAVDFDSGHVLHIFTVRVTDSDASPLSSSAPVLVSLIDINEPPIAADQEFFVLEKG